MRSFSLIVAGLMAASSAHAADPRPVAHPARPAARPAGSSAKSIGKFDDWRAATHTEAGQLVCYAFTRPQPGTPDSTPVPGRSEVVLTVTERPGGRDAVAVTVGFAYPANSEAMMAVDRTELPFYTAGRSAFARDGHAAAAAFDKGRQAVLRSPGPKGGTVVDIFSLRGFSAAYAAIGKACPAK